MLNVKQLYDLGIADNIDIFSGLAVPSECVKLDTDTLKSAIFEHVGLNIPIYPDPDTFRAAVTLWSKKNQYTFLHIDKIMASEYSPIENVFEDKTTSRKFDGTTDTTDSHNNTRTDKSERDISDTLINDITSLEHGKAVTESGTDTNNTTNTISAYDSTTYQPDNKSENSITYGHTSTDSGTDKTTRNYTKKTDNDYTGTITDDGTATGKETRDDTETITETRHGNIGITSANKLQIEEYNMLAQFNPYNFLSELFEKDLTLFIY